MSYSKLKHLLNKKGMLLFLFIVCSIFLCEKGFAVWDKKCCKVYYNSQEHYIKIRFKFFQYALDDSQRNSFIEHFEAQFSTDGGNNYNLLMAASSEDQIAKTCARILLRNKKLGEKIKLFIHPHKQTKEIALDWGDRLNPILNVNNHFIIKNETWLTVYWYPREDLNNIAHIRCGAKWNASGKSQCEYSIVNYNLDPKIAMWNSNTLNSTNSSPQQEKTMDGKNNTVKAIKDANAIVIKGAINQKIQVYTITGKLVKTIVADNDLVKIELSMKQAYFVNVGQKTYKMTL